MNNQQALNTLNEAASQFKGTRQEHVIIQQAIGQLQTLINEDAQRKVDELNKDPEQK